MPSARDRILRYVCWIRWYICFIAYKSMGEEAEAVIELFEAAVGRLPIEAKEKKQIDPIRGLCVRTCALEGDGSD